MPPKISARIKITVIVAGVGAICWVAGCAKKSGQEAVPETRDTLTIVSDTFTDKRDGKTYKTVKMGRQIWMAENLNYAPLSGNARCYKNKKSNCNKYGRLYDWETAMNACPSGWRLPSRWEWDMLGRAAGGERYWGAGTDVVDWFGAGRALKAKKGWSRAIEDGNGGNGTDAYGFSALPGGIEDDVYFSASGKTGFYWAATERDSGDAYCRTMSYANDYLHEHHIHKDLGFSVRCLRNEDSRMGTDGRVRVPEVSDFDTFTDKRDGKTYTTVMIDGMRWMTKNLDYKTSGGSWRYVDQYSDSAAYGRLYDWNTATTVCPVGWHLPSREEWRSLVRAVEGEGMFSEKGDILWECAGKLLKAKHGWNNIHRDKRDRERLWALHVKSMLDANILDGDLNFLSGWSPVNYNGTDDYGFSALPGGRYANGVFDDAGDDGFWWTATADSNGYAYIIRIKYSSAYVSEDNRFKGIGDRFKGIGLSVRCVGD